MATERVDERPADEHDPYARRPGYVTGVDGRTDRTTTAMVVGIVAGFLARVVLGFLGLAEWAALLGGIVIGLVVWLVLRALRRRADRLAGRSPDAVPQARDRAVAEANGGRRFFIAPNPVVVIVMGGIFVAVGVAPLVLGGATVAGLLTAVLVIACGLSFVVQGIGTLVVRRRERSGAQ
jgi:hypothetical protein